MKRKLLMSGLRLKRSLAVEALAARLEALNSIPAWWKVKAALQLIPALKADAQGAHLAFSSCFSFFKMHHRKASSNTEDHGLEHYYSG